MRLLLDTHVLIWWLLGRPALSQAATAAISDPGNAVLVSAVSCYEIAHKQRRGRLLTGLPEELTAAILAEGFDLLPITPRHAVMAGALPEPHRDPWDRLLIAQSRIEHSPIATADPVFAAYGAVVVW